MWVALTDRGTEYCGTPERQKYEVSLAVENIDHTRTKTRHPQTNGMYERFHKTMRHEFARVAFRKKIDRTIEAVQTDLVHGMEECTSTARIKAAGGRARSRCRRFWTVGRWHKRTS